VASHEDQLLAVLQKIGQAETPTKPVVVPDVDAVDDNADEPIEPLEIREGSDQDPNPTPATEMVGPDERQLAPITNRNFFVHHDTHPVVFDIALLKQYQADWFEWEASTLWKEIGEDFRVPSISDHAKTKIQAIKTLHINEWFWNKWEVFCWVTQALNNNIPDFQVMQKPSVAQLINAIDIATMVRSDEEFSLEMQGFVAAAVVEEGILYAPSPIAFCQDEIVQLLKELQIADGEALIGQVQKRYREIKQISPEAWAASPEPILHETAVDIQVAKLKVACDYLSLRRRQLKDQLRLLR